MELYAVGLSLKSTARDEFEALRHGAFLDEAEARLRAVPGVREVVRLATCQRIEFYVGASSTARPAPGAVRDTTFLLRELRRALTGRAAASRLPRDASAAEKRLAEGSLHGAGAEAAFQHLLRIAVGLDSVLRGEAQVLGQMRAAFAAGVERGSTGPFLSSVFHRLFRAARRIRAQAGLDGSSPSWGEVLAGVIASREVSRGVPHGDSHGDSRGDSRTVRAGGEAVHLLGSGAMARSLERHLRGQGVVVVGVESGSVAPGIRGGGVLVTASGRGRILGARELGLSDGTGVLEIWDLGVPRNVDPALAHHPRVRLRTLADLEEALTAASAPIAGALAHAEELIEAEVAAYRAWSQERAIAPTIVRLGRLLELIDLTSGTGEGTKALGRRLLRAFSSVAGEAPTADEAAGRLALFEEVLRRTASGAPGSRGPRRDQESDTRSPRQGMGVVSLVGAGPGDAGLLTLRAAQRLREADVVYHDALVSAEVLALCRPGARLLPVGKRRASQGASQREIESALVAEARAGRSVVRLKGGDPFVFGRGGEEALALVRAGVPFEIIPGVTAGVGAPALAGIPLTHRGIASSAAFVTAHDLTPDADSGAARARLRHLARGADTLVVFMAGAELARVREVLLDAGLTGETPAALIESGTLPEERVERGTLRDLESFGRNRGSGPVLLVVGRTVSLAEELRDGSRVRRASDLAGRSVRTNQSSFEAGGAGVGATEAPHQTLQLQVQRSDG